MSPPEKAEQRLQLENSQSTSLLLHLEPWGEQYPMEPGSVFEVRAKGPRGDGLYVELGNDEVAVWAWSESSVQLFTQGVELDPGNWPRTKVPDAPVKPLRKLLRGRYGATEKGPEA
jgi:hypothetical protein